MSGVLELAPFDAPGLDGQGRGDAFEDLDAGYLVDVEGWDTSGGTLGGEPIGLANVMAVLGELRIGLGVEPPAHTMGFEVDIFIKMRPTERCEIPGTMPRLIASAAGSRWVQWVMARPLSHGPSQIAQASSAL